MIGGLLFLHTRRHKRTLYCWERGYLYKEKRTRNVREGGKRLGFNTKRRKLQPGGASCNI